MVILIILVRFLVSASGGNRLDDRLESGYIYGKIYDFQQLEPYRANRILFVDRLERINL